MESNNAPFLPPNRPAPFPPSNPPEAAPVQEAEPVLGSEADKLKTVNQLIADLFGPLGETGGVNVWARRAPKDTVITDELMWNLIETGSGKVPLMSSIVSYARAYFTDNHANDYKNNLYVNVCIANSFIEYLKTLTIEKMSEPLIFKLTELKVLMSKMDSHVNQQKIDVEIIPFFSHELLNVITQIYLLIQFNSFDNKENNTKLRDRFQANLQIKSNHNSQQPSQAFPDRAKTPEKEGDTVPGQLLAVANAVKDGTLNTAQFIGYLASLGYYKGGKRTRKRSKRSTRKRKDKKRFTKKNKKRFTNKKFPKVKITR